MKQTEMMIRMAAAGESSRLSAPPSGLGLIEDFFTTVAHFRTGGLVLNADLIS
jgi:hypothetical protein